MSQYPTTIVNEVLPLPDYIDQSALNDHGLFVVQGLTYALAEQVVERSKEPDVEQWCPNDAPVRFNSVAAVEAWQAKGRLPLPMVRDLGGGALSLEGLEWMGLQAPSKSEPLIEGARVTYAMRIYKDYAGQHLAYPYTRAILDLHGELFDNNGVWLEAWVKNEKATRTYLKAGFSVATVISGVLHGKPMDRVYMTLDSASQSSPWQHQSAIRPH